MLTQTFLVVNDLISIFGPNYWYKFVMSILLATINILILIAYIILYSQYIILMRQDRGLYSFLTNQVHSFFAFIILLQFGRLAATDTETFTHYLNPKSTEVRLEYFNITTEIIFNIFILYYFVNIKD
jgi:predicted Abi (CAAX) family protease